MNWPRTDPRIEDLLIRWADWVRDDEHKGRYPRTNTIWRLMRYGSGARPHVFYQRQIYMPPDVVQMEWALARMKGDLPRQIVRAVFHVYLGKKSERVAATTMRVSRYRLVMMLQTAHRYLAVLITE